MNMSLNLIRRSSFAIGAVLATLAIVACGSSANSSSSSTSSAAASSGASGARSSFRDPARRAKLVACLKQHGVTLPSRPSGGGRPPGFLGGGSGAAADPKVRAALQACGANFGPGARVSPAARTAAVAKFTTCVGQHGYKLPKPNFSGHGPVFSPSIQSNPKFQAASKACAGLLRPSGAPQGAPGGGGAPPASNA